METIRYEYYITIYLQCSFKSPKHLARFETCLCQIMFNGMFRQVLLRCIPLHTHL